MTTIITATLIASVLYFVAALICRLHDSLAARFRPALDMEAIATASSELGEMMEVFERRLDAPAVELPAELPTSIRSKSCDVGIPLSLPAVANDTRDLKSQLPNSIRELREYIRTNELQATVKERIGKSVSACTKDELLLAIA